MTNRFGELKISVNLMILDYVNPLNFGLTGLLVLIGVLKIYQLQPVFAQWIQNTYALVHWRNDLQAPVRSI